MQKMTDEREFTSGRCFSSKKKIGLSKVQHAAQGSF
jgi:hypothetical protein